MEQTRGEVVPPVREDVPRTLPHTPLQAPPPPRRRRTPVLRWLIILLILLVIGWLIWRLAAGSGHKPEHATPPQPVGVAKVGQGDMHVILTGLGTVTPLATITVQTQINGQLMSVGFKEGQIVHKGDFLAQIDPRPYQVSLAQAKGTLAHDEGLLAQARSDLARYQKLNRQDSIAKQTAADQAFVVQQDEGTVAYDQATVDSSKLNLTYCHITAPVAGRVGLRLVDPGNYVQTGSSTGLVVITELQPISVIFVLPEDNIPEVAQAMQGGATLDVDAYDRTDAHLIAHGTLTTVDNTVDTTTGTVKLRATYANGDFALFPNQFVNVRMQLRTITGATEVPNAAVQHGAPGTFVYLLKPDNTVVVQVIKTGITEGDDTQVTSGLKPGDTVVTDGTDRLKDGARVSVGGGKQQAPAAPNNGPGAPPGEQPQNQIPVPAQQQEHPHNRHRHPGPTQAQTQDQTQGQTQDQTQDQSQRQAQPQTPSQPQTQTQGQ